MVNNFESIKHFLKFDSEDDFYFLQILKRKKENPDVGSNSQVIKTYYVYSLDYLNHKQDEIIQLCNLNNARAYINLNRRSFERIAFHMLKKTTDIIMNKDFKSVKNAYDSVCGEYGSGKDKLWLIDIDPENFEEAPNVKWHLADLQPVGDKVVGEIKTKNGYHIVTTPFDRQAFSKLYPKIDIHSNNPTIIYVP